MALSMFKTLATKGVRARKPVSARQYSYDAHHHVAAAGPLEKRVVHAKVVFPSPLTRSNLGETGEAVLLKPEQLAGEAILSAQEANEVMIDRLHRFRQAILDAHEKHGIEYEHDLGPNEFPSGPLSVKASFGTPDQPMLIPSFAESRLVGCQGGAGPRHHETLWHNVKKNKPLCCLECGQIFRLVDHMEWLEWAATEWDLNKQDTIAFFLPVEE